MSERDEGIQAIIDLQAHHDIVETQENAEAGWDAMTKSQREQTMTFHRIICCGETE